ncbi:hypothetical protein EJ04DRAFT_552198 [Polyplosphaeria fusca]|uniref:Alpha N-terminal protein methyltransferase 1 n=1 Tax=Polyplosphaeria fusca TaxID=682080 RepID=A0A9P4R287_9PLEO|nr:hypothetical protein EJ04DRAFT_552198 [Polyplosphaeria fusca]
MDMDCDPPLLPTAAPDAAIDHAHSITYWSSVSADTNGMLGGYPQTSRIDLQSSSNFLTKLRRRRQPKDALARLNRVADCGAGIGRITKGLLMSVSAKVDVVEPVKKFTDDLVAGLNEEEKETMGEVVNVGLQDWVPEVGGYDLIWNQWCLGHLKDDQLVVYLKRCKEGLAKGDGASQGWVVVKENLSTDVKKQDIYDEEDSSVTRSDEKFRRLFVEAGLKIVATELQKGFPRELYPVRIYALTLT